MGDIGKGIFQLALAEGPVAPVGEAGGLVNFHMRDLARQRFIRRGIAKAADHGGDLGVEQRFGQHAALVVGGPNIIRLGHHQRSTASCTITFCAAVPCVHHRAASASKPWRWWNDSSRQMRTIARAYGAYEQRQSGTWFMIARAVHQPADRRPTCRPSVSVG